MLSITQNIVSLKVFVYRTIYYVLKNLAWYACQRYWSVICRFLRDPFLKTGVTWAVFQSLGSFALYRLAIRFSYSMSPWQMFYRLYTDFKTLRDQK